MHELDLQTPFPFIRISVWLAPVFPVPGLGSRVIGNIQGLHIFNLDPCKLDKAASRQTIPPDLILKSQWMAQSQNMVTFPAMSPSPDNFTAEAHEIRWLCGMIVRDIS